MGIHEYPGLLSEMLKAKKKTTEDYLNHLEEIKSELKEKNPQAQTRLLILNEEITYTKRLIEEYEKKLFSFLDKMESVNDY